MKEEYGYGFTELFATTALILVLYSKILSNSLSLRALGIAKIMFCSEYINREWQGKFISFFSGINVPQSNYDIEVFANY